MATPAAASSRSCGCAGVQCTCKQQQAEDPGAEAAILLTPGLAPHLRHSPKPKPAAEITGGPPSGGATDVPYADQHPARSTKKRKAEAERQAREVHRCPFTACPRALPSSPGWLAQADLLTHIEHVHLAKGECPPDAFMEGRELEICQACRVFLSSKGCPSCKGKQAVPQRAAAAGLTSPAVQANDVTAAEILLSQRLGQKPVNTIKHIPRCFGTTAAEDLGHLLDYLCNKKTLRAMVRLLLFHRAVLGALPRGGKRWRIQQF